MYKLFYISFFALLFFSCRGDIIVFPPETEQHGDPLVNGLQGFYLLNQGNMGSNKATLDFYHFASATYTRDLYSERNPEVALSLGDVGNDLQIYGSRLYAVINVSNKIEVMRADSARRIGQINIPNCRYLCFHGQYGYATSYAGPVQTGKQHAQIGYVARFDTATLQLLDTCLVGYQPDGIAAANNHLFVANSGGYLAPNYETTLSVIDISSFQEIQRVHIAPNLHYVKKDRNNILWVSSRGDGIKLPSRLYAVDTESFTVIDSIEQPVENFCLQGDSLYFFGTEFNGQTLREETIYGIVDINTHRLLTKNFINDNITLKKPYAIAVNPFTHDIYIADAKDYVAPGTLYCLSPQGTVRWQVRTGDIPACITFLKK